MLFDKAKIGYYETFFRFEITQSVQMATKVQNFHFFRKHGILAYNSINNGRINNNFSPNLATFYCYLTDFSGIPGNLEKLVWPFENNKRVR